MQVIELLSCMGCGRIIDHLNFKDRCPRCCSRFSKAIGPSFLILVRWFLTSPKHVFNLIIQDLREKLSEKRS